MKRLINSLINWYISKSNKVTIDRHELQALQLTVENKFLLEKKIELWYKMYKGENFAKFFGLNAEQKGIKPNLEVIEEFLTELSKPKTV